MPTKLGFQLHDAPETRSPTALQRLKALRPVALLCLGSVDRMNQAYDAIGAGPTYVFQRFDMGDAASYINAYPTLEEAVERFIKDIEPLLLQLRWAYHCTFTASAITDDLAQFEALAIRLIHERYGVRLCIGNFATGTPSPEQWAVYRPALDAAVRYNAIVGLREMYPLLPYVGYGPNANIPDASASNPRRLRNEIAYPQGYQQPAALVGRYRYLRDYCRKQKIPVKILITESGAGRVLTDWLTRFGANAGYWRSLTTLWAQFGFNNPEAHYFQDLVWLDQHVYAQDPEVIGTCVFAWNTPDFPEAEIGGAATLLDRLQVYMQEALKDRPLGYTLRPLNPPTQFTVIVPRLRIRSIPSMNTKYIGGFDNGEKFTATHYTFTDGNLWLKHQQGWSVYAPLIYGDPDYDNKYVDGLTITTPRQDSSVNNFVGTISEVRNFLQAHQGNLFYIAIDPRTPPQGARQFVVTTFPIQTARRIIDELHPSPGDPLMTPAAKRKLKDAGQL